MIDGQSKARGDDSIGPVVDDPPNRMSCTWIGLLALFLLAFRWVVRLWSDSGRPRARRCSNVSRILPNSSTSRSCFTPALVASQTSASRIRGILKSPARHRHSRRSEGRHSGQRSGREVRFHFRKNQAQPEREQKGPDPSTEQSFRACDRSVHVGQQLDIEDHRARRDPVHQGAYAVRDAWELALSLGQSLPGHHWPRISDGELVNPCSCTCRIRWYWTILKGLLKLAACTSRRMAHLW